MMGIEAGYTPSSGGMIFGIIALLVIAGAIINSAFQSFDKWFQRSEMLQGAVIWAIFGGMIFLTYLGISGGIK